MTNPTNTPDKILDYPKNESSCHGAPVKVVPLDAKRKYICTECGEWCIPRQKK